MRGDCKICLANRPELGVNEKDQSGSGSHKILNGSACDGAGKNEVRHRVSVDLS